MLLALPIQSGSATPDLTLAFPPPARGLPPSLHLVARHLRLNNMLSMSAVPETNVQGAEFDDAIMKENQSEIVDDETAKEKIENRFAAWQIEAAGVDRSVHILPGVKKMMASIPEGKYCR